MSCGGGHGHNHGHEGSEHGHSHDPAMDDMAIAYSLYQKVDLFNLQCLNEAVEDSGKTVFKPWNERLTRDKFVESDVDAELLFNIPFTDQIKLKGIIIIGGENGHGPNVMRLFKNRPHLTFDEASNEADQEFELHPDSSGMLEYSPKIAKFSSLTHLSIHFPSNFGDEEVSKVYYIGLKGEFTKAHRHGVTLCAYESRPQLSDHKTDTMDAVGRPVM